MAQREFLWAKLHRAVITEAKPDYVGSLTVDADLLRRANMLPNEKVLVVNFSNGERFETYLIEGEPGSGMICLNGPAARKGMVGDRIVAMTFCQLNEKEIQNHRPTVLILNDQNKVLEERHEV